MIFISLGEKNSDHFLNLHKNVDLYKVVFDANQVEKCNQNISKV